MAQAAHAAGSREAEMLMNADDATLEALRPAPFGSDLLDRHTELEMRQRYDLLERKQEIRDSSGLASAQTNISERENMREDLVSEVSQYQVNSRIEKAAETGKGESAIHSKKKPLVVAAAAAALYFGRPIPLRANEDTSFNLMGDMRKSRAQLAMKSPVVGSRIDYNGSGESSMGSASGSDRARVSLNRDIPVLDLGSSVSYGSSSTVTTTVSKQLTKEVAVSVDSARKTRGAESAEESFRVSYGLSF